MEAINTPDKDFWNSLGTLREKWIQYCKAHPKRIAEMAPTYRTTTIPEDRGTHVTIEGFIDKWNGGRSKKIADQEIVALVFDLQFLQHHKEKYLKYSVQHAKSEYSPKTKPALESFKELIVMDITFLAGCDVQWDAPRSPPTPPLAPEDPSVLLSVLRGGNPGDDASTSGEESGDCATKPSPVFGISGQQDSPDKAAPPSPLPENAPPLPPIDDDDAPIIWKRNGAPQKPGAPPDPEDFMTWEPEEWVDFSLIKWPAAGENLGTLKSFFALAIIFFYKPEVQQQHAALWQRLQDKWVESFLGPINDAALQHPPKTGASAFTTEQATWLQETRRYLMNQRKTPNESRPRRSSGRKCQPLPPTAAASKPSSRASAQSQRSSHTQEASTQQEKKTRSGESVKHNSRCDVTAKCPLLQLFQ